MPSWELFEQQDEEYRHSVLPPACTARIAVEQASTIGCDRYVGPTGRIIGMHTFGAAAPLKALLTKFGFPPDKVLTEARAQLDRTRQDESGPNMHLTTGCTRHPHPTRTRNPHTPDPRS